MVPITFLFLRSSSPKALHMVSLINPLNGDYMYAPKMLRVLSSKGVARVTALARGGGAADRRSAKRGNRQPAGRGLHLSTSQLNLSALYGIGVACRGCVARVRGC